MNVNILHDVFILHIIPQLLNECYWLGIITLRLVSHDVNDELKKHGVHTILERLYITGHKLHNKNSYLPEILTTSAGLDLVECIFKFNEFSLTDQFCMYHELTSRNIDTFKKTYNTWTVMSLITEPHDINTLVKYVPDDLMIWVYNTWFPIGIGDNITNAVLITERLGLFEDALSVVKIEIITTGQVLMYLTLLIVYYVDPERVLLELGITTQEYGLESVEVAKLKYKQRNIIYTYYGR